MLGGAGNGGVGGVEVHETGFLHIPCNHAALEEMQVFQAVHQPGGIVQVLQRGFPVKALARIGRMGFPVVHDMDRRARGTEIDLVAGQLYVAGGVLAMQGDVPGRTGDGVFHQRPREPEPVVPVHPTDRSDRLDAARDAPGKAHLLEQVENGAVDPVQVGLLQGQEPSAAQPRPDRSVRLCNRCRAQGLARLSPARSANRHDCTAMVCELNDQVCAGWSRAATGFTTASFAAANLPHPGHRPTDPGGIPGASHRNSSSTGC